MVLNAKKLELGIYSLLQLWGFKGERLRLEPVQRYRHYDDSHKAFRNPIYFLYFFHRYRIENGIEVLHVNKARLSFHGIKRTCSHCGF